MRSGAHIAIDTVLYKNLPSSVHIPWLSDGTAWCGVYTVCVCEVFKEAVRMFWRSRKCDE